MEKKELNLIDDYALLSEVNDINKLLESEKAKQKEDTVKIMEPKESKEEDFHINRQSSTPLNPVSSVASMERLHLRIFGDTIDILYRPNHGYIKWVKNDDDGKAEIEALAKMTRDEFIAYLTNIHCFRAFSRKALDEVKTSSLETWYQGAWSIGTKRVFNELGIENPVEAAIIDTEYNSVKNKLKKK